MGAVGAGLMNGAAPSGRWDVLLWWCGCSGDDSQIPRALPWAVIECPFRAKEGNVENFWREPWATLCVGPVRCSPSREGAGGWVGDTREPSTHFRISGLESSGTNANRRVFGGSPKPTPPCPAPLRGRGTVWLVCRLGEWGTRPAPQITPPQ